MFFFIVLAPGLYSCMLSAMPSDNATLTLFAGVCIRSDKDLETAVRSAEELRCSYEELRSKTKEKLKSVSTASKKQAFDTNMILEISCK